MREVIVLVHGVLGYERLPSPIGEYFVGVADHLRLLGHDVYVPELSPTRGISDRAKELENFLLKQLPFNSKRCHLVAHSMGGLDARYLLHHSQAARIRVQSLVTIGTPHQGSPVAEHLERDAGLPLNLLNTIWEPLRRDTAALHALTTDACRAFNQATPITDGIRYIFIAGDASASPTHSFLFNALAHYGQMTDINDGVVERSSALFVENSDPRIERWATNWAADHGELVGRETGLPSLNPFPWPDFMHPFLATSSPRMKLHLKRYEQVVSALVKR